MGWSQSPNKQGDQRQQHEAHDAEADVEACERGEPDFAGIVGNTGDDDDEDVGEDSDKGNCRAEEVEVPEGDGQGAERGAASARKDCLLGSCISFAKKAEGIHYSDFALDAFPLVVDYSGNDNKDEAWSEGVAVEKVVEWVAFTI